MRERRRPAPVSRLRWAAIGVYALPTLGVSFMENWIAFFLLKFATDELGVAPAVMGLWFAAARVWDGLCDPWVGYASDHTRGRRGRRRPWLLGAALPLAAVFFALWSPPAGLPAGALALWLGVGVVLFFTAQSAFEVPHLALGAERVGAGHDRTRLFAGRLALGIGGTLAAALCMGLVADGGDVRSTASAVAGAGAGFTVLAIALCARRTPEPPGHQGRSGRSPYAAFGDVLRNRDARLLLGVLFLEGLAFACLTTTMAFAGEYWLGDPSLTPVLLVSAVGVIALTIPVWLPLARRFGKRRVWLASLGVRALAFATMLVLPAREPWVLVVNVCVVGASYGCGRMLGPALKADVVDADEAATGERKEGTYFASWNLASKASAGAAVALAGFVLQLTGFEPGAAQTSRALVGIQALFAGLPALFCATAALLLRGVQPRVELTGEFDPGETGGHAGTYPSAPEGSAARRRTPHPVGPAPAPHPDVD